MNNVIFLLLLSLFLSCKEKDVKPKEANMICSDFFVKGQFKNAAYTFCGIIPVEIEYIYKEGKWKFWNLQGQLIAEGAYKLQKEKVEEEGGCAYEIINGTMNEDEWIFLNEKGDNIKPTEDLITSIKLCTDELINKKRATLVSLNKTSNSFPNLLILNNQNPKPPKAPPINDFKNQYYSISPQNLRAKWL